MPSVRQVKRIIKPAVFIASLIPAVWLVLMATNLVGGGLGANPIEAIQDWLGVWALRFILLTLAISPASQLTGMVWMIQLLFNMTRPDAFGPWVIARRTGTFCSLVQSGAAMAQSRAAMAQSKVAIRLLRYWILVAKQISRLEELPLAEKQNLEVALPEHRLAVKSC